MRITGRRLLGDWNGRIVKFGAVILYPFINFGNQRINWSLDPELASNREPVLLLESLGRADADPQVARDRLPTCKLDTLIG